MKTTLNLDDGLMRQAKEHALQRGTTLTSVVEDALRAMLLTPVQGGRFRLRLPVVAGTSEPAIDPADRHALYEAMDADA
ncbi:MAG TPA: hypothetical protein VFD41_13260 [Actinomycetales bacterium]|nr:hypothetical protein [Actinomycetales bacterium]